MLLPRVCVGLALYAAAVLGQSSSQAPRSSSPAACGEADTRVTLCFPGTPETATCVYSVIDKYAVNDLSPNTQQVPCPASPIFGHACRSLPGTLYVAYGPCNSNDVVDSESANHTMSVSAWLDVLGLNTVKELGGLFVRGYAFQEQMPIKNVSFLPELEVFTLPDGVGYDGVANTQVTINGLPMPAMPKVVSIPGGLTILNSPDENFMNPPRFTNLEEISLGISIAGCNHLKTLAGLEALAEGSGISNIEIINDLILADIGALAGLFKCQPDGSTLLNPDLLVGTFGMHPLPLQAQNKGCTLNTPRQVCSYIENSNQCPPNTEYIRFRDGTIQRVPSTPIPAPAQIAPAPQPAAPALAPFLGPTNGPAHMPLSAPISAPAPAPAQR